jgi:hypothetical protein
MATIEFPFPSSRLQAAICDVSGREQPSTTPEGVEMEKEMIFSFRIRRRERLG